MSNTEPFTGIRVVDFTHVLAGPACSYFLGLLGAEVIKVESANKGDAIRHRGGTDEAAAANGMSTSYLTQGSNKSSLTLDLEDSEGQAMMHRLLAQSDVFVENHLPSTLARLGLDESTVRKKHPHLIICAMTGYGRGGPQENAPAYDVNIQASCGIMDMTGTEESGPTRTGAPILDYGTALVASFAISSALYAREKTGDGSFIDVSMLETGFSLMSSSITDYLHTGNAPKRRGNLANSRSPGAGSFPCKEGIISLGVNEESHFVNLANAMSRQDWLSDGRFATRSERKKNADIFAAEIETELAKKTAQDWEEILQNGGVPSARLRSMPEAIVSPHVKARDFIHVDPETGLKTPTLPFRLNGAKSHAPKSAPPKLGENSDEVIKRLGLADD